jgi:predicted membrane-bound spermidine synthase
MKITTNGAAQWLQTLKTHWDISKTDMRDSDEAVIVMCFSVKTQFVVAYYQKDTKQGWVVERRSKVR